MKKDTLVAVGIVGCLVALGGLWLWRNYLTMQSLPPVSEAESAFDPVPVYTDDDDDDDDDAELYSDETDVTRIIVSDSLTESGVDIGHELSDKVIVNDKVVDLPQEPDQPDQPDQ